MFSLPARILISLTCFLVLMGAVAMYVMSRPIQFESSARIWVQARLPADTGSEKNGAVFSPLIYFFNSPIATACEVLSSTIVLENALDRVRGTLRNKNDLPTVSALKGNMKVEPVRDADIIIVSVKHHDPRAAYELCKAIVESFIQVTNQQAAGSAVQSRSFLEKQLARAKNEYVKTRTSLKEFQDQTSVDLTSQIGKLMSEQDGARKDIEVTQLKLAETRSKIRFIESQLGITGELSNVLAIEKIAGDPIFNKLRDELAEQQVKLISLRSKLQPGNPRLDKADQIKKKTEEALLERVRELGGPDVRISLDQIPADPGMREKLASELVEAHSEELGQEKRLALLQTLYRNASQRLKALPAFQARHADLTRTEKVAADTLSETEKHLQTAKLVETVASEASNIQVIDQPEIPTSPYVMNRYKNLALATIGALIATGSVFLGLTLLNPFIHAAAQITRVMPAPFAGFIGKPPNPQQLTKDLSDFHKLRVALRSWWQPGENKKVIVMSPNHGDGKSAVAVGLALSLSQNGKRVLLVDGNLGSPQLQQYLPVKQQPGVGDSIRSGQLNPDQQFQRVSQELFVLAAGAQGNSWLEEPRLLRSLKSYEQSFDVVIYDTQSTTDSGDALSLLDPTARVLVVVRMMHSRKQSLDLLTAQLKQNEIASVAVVMTSCNQRTFSSTVNAAPTMEPTISSSTETTAATW